MSVQFGSLKIVSKNSTENVVNYAENHDLKSIHKSKIILQGNKVVKVASWHSRIF